MVTIVRTSGSIGLKWYKLKVVGQPQACSEIDLVKGCL